ncbi:MAG: cation:proton antiporter [Bacteroidaceae bacterium]|nr:cation:proton antiporter [Bacteroidaceae bacterium]
MIHDLCIIMLTAGITSLLFKFFKQPVVLGYIVAGMIAGPYMCGQSWIDDEASVDMWGEIGVLFLLFAMGLEFSFKKLLQVGSTALIAAGTVVVGMMSVGFLLGRILGWDEINSLFLGGMLCMSSTTIVFKAIEDLNLGSHKFAKVAFGILIVEDLFAVVLMVLLSSIAVEKQFAGTQLLMELGKLIAYLVLWFVVGIAIIPTFLKKFRKHLNDETLTIFAIGLCLGMVLLAIGAGFSSALGAFVMGSVLAETIEAERIEHLVLPIKNVFGSIFFVSVGMMINPELLLQYWLPIVIITLTVIIGQIIFASLGTLLSGQSLKVSLQTGFTLVQIGEFAFIIADFGQTAGVTESSLYPIVVAVSVITTFLTPFIMRLADPAENYLNKHLSPGIKLFIENYAQRKNTVSSDSIWKTYLRKVGVTMIVSGIITAFIYLVYFRAICPFILSKATWLNSFLKPETALLVMKIIALVIIIGSCSPFIYNIASRHRNSKEAKILWNSGNGQKAWLAGLLLLRILIGVGVVSYAIVRIFTLTSGMLIGISLLLIVIIMMSRSVKRRSRGLEEQFNKNLTAREVSADKRRPFTKAFESSLLPYDIHISTFTLPADSSFSGKTLSQLNVRKHSGVSIVRIIRAGVFTNIPGGSKHVYPGDQIVVAGSDEQIDKFKQMIDGSIMKEKPDTREHVTLENFTLEEGNPLIGRSIIESNIRNEAHCIVMGIKRGNDYLMNPEPQEVFEPDDIIIVAGETELLKQFINSFNP